MILLIVARKILHLALPFEHQQMVDHLIHEIAIVAHDDDTTGKILQIFLQHLQRLNIEVVGRLVQHQEVGIAHQNGAKIEFAPLTAAELVNEIVLLLRGEEKILQKLAGCHPSSATQVNLFGDVGDDVNHLLLHIKLQSVLREIAKPHRFANVETTAIGRHKPQQHLDER